MKLGNFFLSFSEGITSKLNALDDFLLRSFVGASFATISVSQAEVALKEASLAVENQAINVMLFEKLCQLVGVCLLKPFRLDLLVTG